VFQADLFGPFSAIGLLRRPVHDKKMCREPAEAPSWPYRVRASGRRRSVPGATGRCVRSPRRSFVLVVAPVLAAGACGNAKVSVSQVGNFGHEQFKDRGWRSDRGAAGG
jgi:hypothetical protein